MKYKEITITIEGRYLEQVTAWLMDMGILSMQIEDGKAGLLDLIIYLPPKSDDQMGKIGACTEIENDCGTGDADFRIKDIKIRTADDSAWKESYKEHFHITEAGKKLVIVPSWERRSFDQGKHGDRIPIYLDPGMAFGTGAHATTRMCLEFMEKTGCKGKNVLDVGTGTGILAIGAAALGADRVLGIEIDEEAVSIARENVKMNPSFTKPQCDQKKTDCQDIKIESGNLVDGVDFKADIITANLFVEVVAELMQSVSANIRPDGKIICSGILEEKLEIVKSALAKAEFEIEDVKKEEEWVTVLAEKRR